MSTSGVEVSFFDTTLRDGAQALPEEHQFPEGSKEIIGALIARLGVGVIEAGFPATPGDVEEVTAVAKTVGQVRQKVAVWQDGRLKRTDQQTPVIAGLARATPGDIEATWDSIHHAHRARIHTFVSTDHEHMKAKFPNETPDSVLRMGGSAVSLARSLVQSHPDATVEFSAEAASTTDMAYLERVIKEAMQQGADVINVPDTVGQCDPFEMYLFYKAVIAWVMESNPSVTVSAHPHNDLGNATANTLSLVRAASEYASTHDTGVKVQLETTIAGLGERAGNADVFSVAGGLFKFSKTYGAPVEWRFNPGRSVHTAQAVLAFAGLSVPRQTPIVGSDTNVHRSGIHSDGVIKGSHRIYTPHDPTFWGHASEAVHEEGRYQGTNGRRHILKTDEV